MEICEALHKPLKDAYRRSNHINAMLQIIRTYTWIHGFSMREKNLEQWIKELEHIPKETRDIIRSTRAGIHLPKELQPYKRATKLLGRINMRQIYNLRTLEAEYQLLDIQSLTMKYLTNNLYYDSAFDASHLRSTILEAFHTLQVTIPTFNDDSDTIHHAHSTGSELFRKREQRSDWVFVRWQNTGQGKL